MPRDFIVPVATLRNVGLVVSMSLGLVLTPSVSAETVPAQAQLSEPANRPSPELGPDEVVRIQLENLRANDAADTGIATAFRFASPANRAQTGPLPRFVRMIKEGVYSLMLDYQGASYDDVEISGDLARQRVTLIGPGQVITYVFILSRQSGAPCDGCWMTDAVVVELPDRESA